MPLRIFEVFENSPAAVLQHVEHQLEAFGAFVIGVGNMVPTGVAAEKLPHAEDLFGGPARRREPVDVLVVHVVHDDDHVEPVEILLPDLPGAVAEVVTPDRKSTRLNSSHTTVSRMPSSA